MYTVSDLMTRHVVTLKETDDLALADTILKLGRLRHLPVVRDRTLVGLVTHRDLIRALAEQRPAAQPALARDVMTREVKTVEPDTSLRRAIKMMLRNKFGCLPVIDSDGSLVGIITEADFLRFSERIVADLDRVEELGRAAKQHP